ncbi:acyl-CoA dehydrogenase family protein [Prauserella cavernicola]|uniref:Acyl-CoA/acyl-ACP dehydrogenase n=1 Tax=Prauserella cavernicola TaxID=2800127 RepID=A0A934V780_9PSEU|nr:acyl-CoA dehydrogenase family protein [Prauserella cavernicola]MBK1787419.1 acyl-CoA/acyl-ACP dehydrogenase [Prauserella cavernicola]
MSPRITPDADAEELRSVVRDFLARYGDAEVVLGQAATGQSWVRELWRRFAVELGAVALDVPEDAGGAGAGFREVAIVAEELGRSLVRSPWFSTAVLGVGVLLEVTDATELLAEVASGATTATLAYREDYGDDDPAVVRTTAERDRHGEWFLTGRKTLVVEGATADVVFVVASVEGESTLFAVDGAAKGLERTPVRALDPTRQLAELGFERTPARLLGDPGDARPVLDRVLDRAVAALSCEQAGGAAAALDMSVAHAGTRLQFGRPIGTFQAIKHRCADMAVHVEAARSASLWAAAAASDDQAALPAAAATAALVCGEAYTWVAAETVQVHGGIGFTWEHPAHLHVRRAATSSALFGDRTRQRESLLARLGI